MRVASRSRNARSCVTNTTAPAIVGEERFEPGDRLDVEVIGRLVEQQQVGLADERARQQDAALPAARQRVDNRVAAAATAATSPCRPDAGAATHRDRRADRDPRRRPRPPCDRPTAARPAPAAPRARRAAATPGPHPAADRRSRICSSVDLPVPLRPMTAIALAGIDLERDLIEQRQMAEGEGDTVERDERHGIYQA